MTVDEQLKPRPGVTVTAWAGVRWRTEPRHTSLVLSFAGTVLGQIRGWRDPSS